MRRPTSVPGSSLRGPIGPGRSAAPGEPGARATRGAWQCGEQRGGARQQVSGPHAQDSLRVAATCGSRDGVASSGQRVERPDPQHRRGPRGHIHLVGGAPHTCRAQPGLQRPLPRLPPPHHGCTRVAVSSVGDRQGDGAAPRRKRAPVTNGAGFTDPAAGVLGGGALVAGSIPMRGWRVTAGPMRSAAYSDAASAPLWHAAPHG
jgi:hypothetical protein